MKKHFVTYVFKYDKIVCHTTPTDNEEVAKSLHFGYVVQFENHVVKTYCLTYKNGNWEMELVAEYF